MAEQSVCGCILISETCFPTVRKILQADHFTTDWGRAIFKASEALADRNEVIDPVTIQKEAMRQGYELTNDLLMQLMEITPSVKPAGPICPGCQGRRNQTADAEPAGGIAAKAGR